MFDSFSVNAIFYRKWDHRVHDVPVEKRQGNIIDA